MQKGGGVYAVTKSHRALRLIEDVSRLGPMMLQFAEALSRTPLSQAIRFNLWVIPWIQIVHLVTMALVMSSVFMVSMRILGFAGARNSMSATAHRFLPFIWWGLLVMSASGILLVIGEPVRSLVNVAFWIKMGLLLTGLIAAGLFDTVLRRRGDGFERRTAVRGLALATFGVFCGVIISGRWIAYAFVPPS